MFQIIFLFEWLWFVHFRENWSNSYHNFLFQLRYRLTNRDNSYLHWLLTLSVREDELLSWPVSNISSPSVMGPSGPSSTLGHGQCCVWKPVFQTTIRNVIEVEQSVSAHVGLPSPAFRYPFTDCSHVSELLGSTSQMDGVKVPSLVHRHTLISRQRVVFSLENARLPLLMFSLNCSLFACLTGSRSEI